eukprot:scaffold4961_cov114-Isochrysis_galbana.AAC.11
MHAALTTANAPQGTTRRHCSNDPGLRARARPQEGYEPQNCHGPGAPLTEAPMLQDTPLAPQKQKIARFRFARSLQTTAAPAATAATLVAAAARAQPPKTAPVRDLKRGTYGMLCGGPAWATPRTAAAPQVRGAGGRRRKRAGSARTCSNPRLGAPMIRRVEAWSYASQPAAKPRRSSGAASAAAHHNPVGVVALPKEAAHVHHVLAAPPQLWCAETGRPAWERRPASLRMVGKAVPRARGGHPWRWIIDCMPGLYDMLQSSLDSFSL